MIKTILEKKIFYLILGIMIGVLINFVFIIAQSSNPVFFSSIWDSFLKKNENLTPSSQNTSKEFLTPYVPISDLESRITNIVDKSAPSVVSIVISKYVPVIERYYVDPFEFFDLPPDIKPFFNFDFGVPRYQQKGLQKEQVGGGTGFVVSSDGLILTNKHVVNDDKAEYTVYLNDGRKFKAKVLALHPVDDIALIKIEANNLTPVKLGNSDDLRLGQFVIAIGNALGEFQNTVSIGVVSGLKRSFAAADSEGKLEKLEDMIQTDAAINFGNSGGPLINLKGEVIGINTAIVSSAQNIGFAIPINRAKRMIEEFSTKGKIEVPFLGVRYIMIDEEVQKKFNLPVKEGAYIYSDPNSNLKAIIPNSPAEKYGLKEGDIILEVDGEKVNLKNSLGKIILNKKVNQNIRLKILRESKQINLNVILGVMPNNLE